MNKKGFTLIELLATIAILAIVILIAGTSVVNIIDASKKNAFRTSTMSIVETANLLYSKRVIDGSIITPITFTYNDGAESSTVGGIKLEYEGDKPDYGTLTLNEFGAVEFKLYNDGYCALKSYSTKDVVVNKTDLTTCTNSSLLPSITLVGGNTININVGDTYTESGYNALNGIGGTTNNVNIEIFKNSVLVPNITTTTTGIFEVKYTVVEGTNSSSVTRTVNVVDTLGPVITLVGNATMSLTVGSAFTEPGFSATDNLDGNLTSSVVVSGSVNTSLPGTYVKTYTVTDSSLNTTSVTRTITVTGDVYMRFAVTEGFGNEVYSYYDSGAIFNTAYMMGGTFYLNSPTHKTFIGYIGQGTQDSSYYNSYRWIFSNSSTQRNRMQYLSYYDSVSGNYGYRGNVYTRTITDVAGTYEGLSYGTYPNDGKHSDNKWYIKIDTSGKTHARFTLEDNWGDEVYSYYDSGGMFNTPSMIMGTHYTLSPTYNNTRGYVQAGVVDNSYYYAWKWSFVNSDTQRIRYQNQSYYDDPSGNYGYRSNRYVRSIVPQISRGSFIDTVNGSYPDNGPSGGYYYIKL